MRNRVINTVGWILIVAGFILAFGAAGHSDMCERAGEYLPFMVTAKKLAVSVVLMITGAVLLSRKGGK